ncbi:hypothetical protein ACLOJK_014789 [Asimina triloba]
MGSRFGRWILGRGRCRLTEMEKNDGDGVTVGRRRMRSHGWGGRDRCGVADSLQQTEKKEEEAGEGGRSGDGRPEAGLDRAQVMGRWLAGDDGEDRVQEI